MRCAPGRHSSIIRNFAARVEMLEDAAVADAVLQPYSVRPAYFVF